MAYIASDDLPFVIHVEDTDAATMRPTVIRMMKERVVMHLGGDGVPQDMEGMLLNFGAMTRVLVTDTPLNTGDKLVIEVMGVDWSQQTTE